MQLTEFAKTILLSPNISDKLMAPNSPYKDDQRSAKSFMVENPSRCGRLKLTSGRDISQKFPRNFEAASSRGIALHSFANHELLALELMALCLIKFPDADPSFRKGLYFTMLEEQEHCRLYIERMNQLGVELGDVPVNSFFWDTMSDMKSPLDFITKMSLVFEQANLDYSLYYCRLFRKLEDHTTADLMQRVYDEEIGHVRHGIKWFNEWDDSNKDMFSSHQEKLQFPLSLTWAKGIEFDEVGRAEAGFPEEYVESLKTFQRSRGSVPEIHYFNPDWEEKLEHPKKDKSNKYIESFKDDLGFVSCFIARSHDVCVLARRPSNEHLNYWKKVGFTAPEIVESENLNLAIQETRRDRKVSAVVPWGGNKTYFEQNTRQKNSAEARLIFSKTRNQKFLAKFHLESGSPLVEKETYKYCIGNYEELLSKSKDLFSFFDNIVIKNEFGSSGRGNLKLNETDLKRENITNFLKHKFDDGSEVLLEGWRQRICDFSFVGDLSNENASKSINLLRPLSDHLGQYRGHFIGGYPVASLSEKTKKTLYDPESGFFEMLEDLKIRVESYLSGEGYFGPYGVDLFLYHNLAGALCIQVSEINTRRTMGHVAEKLGKILGKKPPHLWVTLPVKAIKTETIEDLMTYSDESYFPLAPVQKDSQFCSFILRGRNFRELRIKLRKTLRPNSTKFLDEIESMLH